jgi:hypothetical protein
VIDLSSCESVVDRSGIADRLEALLPSGARSRQLSVRTLLVGILLTLSDGRPAHLSRVHRALVTLPCAVRVRLGVDTQWKQGVHQLTYRQLEYTVARVCSVLKAATQDRIDTDDADAEGASVVSCIATVMANTLIEASVPDPYKSVSTALAVDWTDVETFARPPGKDDPATCDPDASWGHRRGDNPGQRDELFFGYYLSMATMVNEDHGMPVPELVRSALVTPCRIDPVPAFVSVLKDMAASGVELGDVLADSGYSHRLPENWSLPVRALGAELIMDLHPHDRGQQGTYGGAICANGSLYCPATPSALLGLEPLARGASAIDIAAHDIKSAELARYKLGRLTRDDAEGFHRVACPAAMGKVRCPKKELSMALPNNRPEIFAPPSQPCDCCTQVSITIPPSVNAKTRQKYDYPSAAHRRSYGRRSAAERANSTIKDPASNDIARGWCRIMGQEAMTMMLACVIVVRNLRVLESFERRQALDRQRQAQGLPPKTRQRQRMTMADLMAASPTA